jgi:hypothetical protein
VTRKRAAQARPGLPGTLAGNRRPARKAPRHARRHHHRPAPPGRPQAARLNPGRARRPVRRVRLPDPPDRAGPARRHPPGDRPQARGRPPRPHYRSHRRPRRRRRRPRRHQPVGARPPRPRRPARPPAPRAPHPRRGHRRIPGRDTPPDRQPVRGDAGDPARPPAGRRRTRISLGRRRRDRRPPPAVPDPPGHVPAHGR